MNRSSARLQRAFALVFAAGLVALAAVAWSTHEQSVRLDDTAGRADRTRADVAAIEAISLGVLEAESSQRGHLIGAPHGLPRYREAVAAARAELDLLGRQVGADPAQAVLLAGLRGAVETPLARLAQAVAVTATQPDQARALVLDGTDAQNRRLCLEITETAAVTHIADAARFVDQVRAVGVKVALDDFGAGAASFGYLKTLRVDTLKIDGQFVRDLVDDPLDEVAVRCFADVAKVMGLTTVAEFVDKPAVLARLRAMDVDYAQGYLLHEPAPIDQLIERAPAVA